MYGGWIYFFFVFICDSFQWLLFSKNNRSNERFRINSTSFFFSSPILVVFDVSNNDPDKSRFNSRNRGRHEQI